MLFFYYLFSFSFSYPDILVTGIDVFCDCNPFFSCWWGILRKIDEIDCLTVILVELYDHAVGSFPLGSQEEAHGEGRPFSDWEERSIKLVAVVFGVHDGESLSRRVWQRIGKIFSAGIVPGSPKGLPSLHVVLKLEVVLLSFRSSGGEQEEEGKAKENHRASHCREASTWRWWWWQDSNEPNTAKKQLLYQSLSPHNDVITYLYHHVTSNYRHFDNK